MDWKFPTICGGKSMVDVANSLTEVINFNRLVDNFRISFSPDKAESSSKTFFPFFA